MYTISTQPFLAFLFGPWLLLALLLFPPFAVLFTLVIVVLVAAVLVVALGAIAATPFWVVRHLRAVRARHETPWMAVEPIPTKESPANSPVTTGPEVRHA